MNSQPLEEVGAVMGRGEHQAGWGETRLEGKIKPCSVSFGRSQGKVIKVWQWQGGGVGGLSLRNQAYNIA